jgi:nucleoside-diphosphate kinase
MAMERTFSIIKPNAVSKNVMGEIISRFEKRGLRLAGAKLIRLSREKPKVFTLNIKIVRFSRVSFTS